MKRTYKLILAVIATSLAFTSCSDELFTGENGYSQSEGSRTIAVSFGPQTRTALGEDGLTPEFTGKDEWVKVSHNNKSEDCQITVDDEGNASFKTSLLGTLTAVYPATAAKMNGDAIEGVNVSSVQDGTFTNANICMAENITENEARFINQTALFTITPPDGTTKLIVKSLEQVNENSGQRTDDASPITTDNGNAAFAVTATSKDADGKIYVSLCQGVKLSDLSFEAEFSTTGTGSIKGIPMKDIKEAKAENTIVGGTIYTINGNNWHEYVTIYGVKWATMNIGASKSEEYGRYFAWGDITGQEANLSIETIDAVKENAFETGFFTAPALEPTNPAILPLKYDAANANWGGAWRIPTKDEYDVLATMKSENSFYFGTFPNQIFLPAAGGGDEKDLCYMEEHGNYVSSTLDATTPDNCCFLLFVSEGIGTWTSPRKFGFSVRAVVNESKVKNPFSGEVTVNRSGKKVKFTRGNLYWDGAALHIEDEQWKTLPTENGIGRDEGHVSHFHFCNTVEIAASLDYKQNDSKNDYLFCDENHKITIDGLSKLYVLTIDEWWYLLRERTKAKGTASSVESQTDARFMMCNLQYDEENSIYGTLIFPDVFTWPSSVSVPASNKFNTGLKKTNAQTFTSADFAALESAGVVFIPAAGLRSENAKIIDNFNVLANYWSSTPDYWVPTLLFNYEGGTYAQNNNFRYSASSIRLVKNVQ